MIKALKVNEEDEYAPDLSFVYFQRKSGPPTIFGKFMREVMQEGGMGAFVIV